MTLPKFAFPPEKGGYSFSDPIETERSEVFGGVGRYRKGFRNGTYKVNVSWNFNPREYTYARTFYRTIVESGSLPFLIDLITDNGELLQEHTARFIPGTFALKSYQGDTYSVGATLEVSQLPITQSAIDLTSLITIFGQNYEYYMASLDTIINDFNPSNFGYVV